MRLSSSSSLQVAGDDRCLREQYFFGCCTVCNTTLRVVNPTTRTRLDEFVAFGIGALVVPAFPRRVDRQTRQYTSTKPHGLGRASVLHDASHDARFDQKRACIARALHGAHNYVLQKHRTHSAQRFRRKKRTAKRPPQRPARLLTLQARSDAAPPPTAAAGTR